jgi:protein pelota
MRLHRRIEKDLSGSVEFHPESPEDTWAIFQLLEDGDRVTASDDRKTATGERVRLRLTLELAAVRDKATFDPATGQIRVTGRNTEGSEHVKQGAFHTLGLDVRHKVALHKERWDPQLHLARLRDMEAPAAAGAVVAVVMMDAGSAQVCFVGGSLTTIAARVELAVPKKRTGAQGHEQGMQRFFEALAQSLLRHVDFSVCKAVVLASPGFVKDDFLAFALREAASREALRPLLDNRAKFVLARAAGGGTRHLPDALRDPVVAARLADTRAAGEVAALARFFEVLATDSARAQYGWRHVRAAADGGAVEALVVCDSLLRVRDAAARSAYAALLAECRAAGADVHLVSSMHAAGEQVAQMGGLCAVLRFAVHDIDEAAARLPRAPGASTGAGHSASAGAGAGAGAGVGVDEGAAGSGADGSAASAPRQIAGTRAYESDSDASVDSDASEYRR